jgi:hypothetical protein
LARQRGIDFSEAGNDLRVLLDLDHLRAFRAAVQCEGLASPFQFYWLVSALARIASPYLEWVATDHQEGALAERMAYVARLLDSPELIDGEESWKTATRELLPPAEERIRRQARRVEAALTQGKRLAEHGYEVLVRMRGELVRQVVDLAGTDLDSQIEMLKQCHRYSREWARCVMYTVLMQDQLVAPLRERTVCLMEFEMRRWSGAEPWEGRHDAEFPKRLLKGNRDFNPEYIAAVDNVAGSPVFRIYDPRIFAL